MASKTQQAATEAVEATNLFGQLYNDSKETIKKQNFNVAERSLERKFQSAYDDALAKIDDLKMMISNERVKLNNMNINTILSYRAQIDALTKAMEYTAEEYTELFGKELSK